MHPQRNAGIVVDTEEVHVGKANKHLADARRVRLHRGSRGSVVCEPRFSEPPCRVRWTTPCRSDPTQIRSARNLPARHPVLRKRLGYKMTFTRLVDTEFGCEVSLTRAATQKDRGK
jgi:hypothetical protein